MQPNTQQAINLYAKLGDQVGPDGQPVLSIVQVSTPYMQERLFDATTGAEQSPLMIALDPDDMAKAATEIQTELDSATAITDMMGQVKTSGAPVQIKVAQPAGQGQVAG